jgi:hypothetical protein
VSPRLRPGVAVVRRDDRHLQLGLEPPHRVVLPDVPEIRTLLDALSQGRPAGASTHLRREALARIATAGLLEPAKPASTSTPSVALSGPRALLATAAPALRAAGVALADHGEVGLVLAYGAVRRDLLDPLVRDGLPHLVAALTAWGWEIGPFVLPGQTACLRCVDAALADHDPRHGVVLDQIARAGLPVPADAGVETLAMGWIARDLAAYGRGARPASWSTTVRLARVPGEEPVSERRWLRHPRCGCAWDALTG